MVLIFGGKYQGKVEYALKEFGLKESDVSRCETSIDYSKKIVAGLEEYIWNCTLKGAEASETLDMEKLQDKIVICDDVTGGLVPMEKEERAYREMVGRTMMCLGNEADQVIRVFCGLGHRLK